MNFPAGKNELIWLDYMADPYSRVESMGEGSGWVWIRKHTGFLDGLFHDLRLNVIMQDLTVRSNNCMF